MEPLPAPSELLSKFPVSLTEKDFVRKSRDTVSAILNGRDPRTLLIVGPCSLHDFEQSLEYAIKLKTLADEVDSTFYIVMRAYFEKPRTALGWRGLLHDPHLDGSCDIQRGLHLTRQLFQEIVKLGLPLACEFLDPASHLYFSDCVSWGCIGARTATSQVHRQLASQLLFPIGFKNCTAGTVSAALNGIEVAKTSQVFLGVNENGLLTKLKTFGNPDAHLVMRGGEDSPNYSKEHIGSALLKTPYVIIDCSHDNSRKQHLNQILVFNEIIDQIKDGNQAIKGLMLESFLNEGSQPISQSLKHGISITDPCLDFNTTQTLIRQGAKNLQCASL